MPVSCTITATRLPPSKVCADTLMRPRFVNLAVMHTGNTHMSWIRSEHDSHALALAYLVIHTEPLTTQTEQNSHSLTCVTQEVVQDLNNASRVTDDSNARGDRVS